MKWSILKTRAAGTTFVFITRNTRISFHKAHVRNLYALFSCVKKAYTANQNGVQLFSRVNVQPIQGRSQGGSWGARDPPVLQAFFNKTTYDRWRKCHDDILAIVKKPLL